MARACSTDPAHPPQTGRACHSFAHDSTPQKGRDKYLLAPGRICRAVNEMVGFIRKEAQLSLPGYRFQNGCERALNHDIIGSSHASRRVRVL